MLGIAYAMGQGGGAAGNGAAGFTGFIPLILMFVIFYFLLIRPQQKKTKEHREMIASLKKGDRIITSGGIYGRITGLDSRRNRRPVRPGSPWRRRGSPADRGSR